ncbi:MAG: GHKL domain-containing protein, partial [Candidatus Moranbacteria bacterium]|nr:GHKL domain-containing protein [Candidatus Moranbacteria bacterium]
KKIQSSSDWFFFGGNNPRTVIKDVSIKLNNLIKIKSMHLFLIKKLKQILRAQKVIILIKNDQGVYSRSLSQGKLKPPNFDLDPLINQVSLKDELNDHPTLIKYLTKNKLEVVIPLTRQDRRLGYIFLGEKRQNDAYYNEELEFLQIMAPQASIAIENALLYEKTRHFNLKLKKQVSLKTQQLKKAQIEKITQIYRFAEFGKLASGVIHDLVNPLTALVLNIEYLQGKNYLKTRDLKEVKNHLDKAVKITQNMQGLINAVKKQIKKQESINEISLKDEINQVIQIFAYKARDIGVRLRFLADQDVVIHANPVKFNQVLSNLIANALDACQTSPAKNKQVTVKLQVQANNIKLKVIDTGTGIALKHLNQIFNPLFTTKAGHGTGIGLSICQEIIQNDFQGWIKAKNRINKKGAVFEVEFSV